MNEIFSLAKEDLLGMTARELYKIAQVLKLKTTLIIKKMSLLKRFTN